MRERRNELTGREQIGAKMNRQGLHAHVRHVEAACAKRFRAEARDTDGHVFQNEWKNDEPGI